jgi:hypothetical protein
VLADDRLRGESAPRRAEPDAGHPRAHLVHPTAAVVTDAAVDERHDRDPVAGLDRRHLGADGIDVGGELRDPIPGERMGIVAADDRLPVKSRSQHPDHHLSSAIHQHPRLN